MDDVEEEELEKFIKHAVYKELHPLKEEQTYFKTTLKSLVSEQLNLMSIIIRHHKCLDHIYKLKRHRHRGRSPKSNSGKEDITDSSRRTTGGRILSPFTNQTTPLGEGDCGDHQRHWKTYPKATNSRHKKFAGNSYLEFLNGIGQLVENCHDRLHIHSKNLNHKAEEGQPYRTFDQAQFLSSYPHQPSLQEWATKEYKAKRFMPISDPGGYREPGGYRSDQSGASTPITMKLFCPNNLQENPLNPVSSWVKKRPKTRKYVRAKVLNRSNIPFATRPKRIPEPKSYQPKKPSYEPNQQRNPSYRRTIACPPRKFRDFPKVSCGRRYGKKNKVDQPIFTVDPPPDLGKTNMDHTKCEPKQAQFVSPRIRPPKSLFEGVPMIPPSFTQQQAKSDLGTTRALGPGQKKAGNILVIKNERACY